MITVIETWYLNDEATGDALYAMQEMDDLTGPAAHGNSGWSGHARFYQRAAEPSQVLMVYPWSDRASHDRLRSAEEANLQDFYARRCSRPRHIEILTELDVDVDDDHPGH